MKPPARRPLPGGEATSPRLSDWQYVRQLWPYLWRQPNVLWVSLVLYPLSALSSALPPLLLAKMFDLGIEAGRAAGADPRLAGRRVADRSGRRHHVRLDPPVDARPGRVPPPHPRGRRGHLVVPASGRHPDRD